MKKYKQIALNIRTLFLKMHYEAKSGHIGTGLSIIDLLTYIYSNYLNYNDKFVLSKGHGASSLYATLHYFDKIKDISSYYKDNTKLAAHPVPNAYEDIVIATGSLGHGLSVSAGLAYSYKYLLKNENKVVCIASDGECNEGSIWEAIMFAAHHNLNNLTFIIDSNKLQGFGETKDVINMESLSQKLKSFNFNVIEIDGHNFKEIDRAFKKKFKNDKPKCIIANTVKGKGVQFMENKLEWHYNVLTDEQYMLAVKDLEDAQNEISNA